MPVQDLSHPIIEMRTPNASTLPSRGEDWNVPVNPTEKVLSLALAVARSGARVSSRRLDAPAVGALEYRSVRPPIGGVHGMVRGR